MLRVKAGIKSGDVVLAADSIELGHPLKRCHL